MLRIRNLFVAALLVLWSCGRAAGGPVQEGDIVFQTSLSEQSQAIQLATHSPYSHMGLVLFQDGRPFVLEAIAHVKLTPLKEWVARGKGGRYVVKRLRDPTVLKDPGKISALRKTALGFIDLPYDPYFEWSDDRLYCSELVWKAYDRALGIQLGTPAPLNSFDLSDPIVKAMLAERYGSAIPEEAQIVSPGAIFNSQLLVEVR